MSEKTHILQKYHQEKWTVFHLCKRQIHTLFRNRWYDSSKIFTYVQVFLICGRVRGLWQTYQAISTLPINYNIANAGKHRVVHAATARVMAPTGMPTGERDRAWNRAMWERSTHTCKTRSVHRPHERRRPNSSWIRAPLLRPCVKHFLPLAEESVVK